MRLLTFACWLMTLGYFGLTAPQRAVSDEFNPRLHIENGRVVLTVNGQTNEGFFIESSASLGLSETRWTPFNVLYLETNTSKSIPIDPIPAVRFFKASRIGRPLTCDLDRCPRETSSGTCPTNGPPDLPANRDRVIPTSLTPIKTIRLLFQVLAYGDGTDRVFPLNAIAGEVQQLNDVFRSWRLQFVSDQIVRADDQYRNLDPGDDALGQASLLRQRHGTNFGTRLNVFLTHVEDLGFGGQTVLPWLATTNNHGVVLNARRLGLGQLVLAHEIGHALGLWHTHRGAADEEVAECTACWERAAGGDPDRTGDFCSDTTPTPLDVHGQIAGLLDECSKPKTNWSVAGLDNIMSAYPHAGSRFTPQQAGRMHAWIDHRLSGWLDTNTPAAPTDLRVVANDFGEVELNWTDNSWNETGLRILRLTNDTDWMVVATLPANTVSFFDDTSLPGRTNTYRVIAINTNATNSQGGLALSYPTYPDRSAVPARIAPIVYLDAGFPGNPPPDGTITNPYPTFAQALGQTAEFSTNIFRVSAAHYNEPILISNKAVRIEARGGSVLIGEPGGNPP